MKALQPPVPLLTLAGLRDFSAQQTKRHDDVQCILTRGQADIAQAKSNIEPFLTGERKRVGTVEVRLSHPADGALQAQVVAKQYQIRQAINLEIRPIFQKMLAAKTLAEEYMTRHWQKIQVLNRATTGSGLTDSMVRRAAYAEVFAQAGKAQLWDFGQLAVDTADPVLADCLFRAVAAIPTADRPFQPAAFLALVQNAEWTEAQQLLEGVVESFRSAKRGIDIFGGGKHGQVTVDQIESGLRAQDKKSDEELNIDDILDAAGGIREDAVLRLGQQVNK